MTWEVDNPLAAAFREVDLHPEDRRALDRIAARFDEIDPVTGCIFLKGARFADGRPKIMVDSTRRSVARVIVAALHQKHVHSSTPWEARHTCGNAECVAPAHLEPGDAAANAADRDAHGRTARGERNGMSKLVPS